MEGFPLLVLHFCFVQSFRLCCGFFKGIPLDLSYLPNNLGIKQNPLKNVAVFCGPVLKTANLCSRPLLSYNFGQGVVLFWLTIDPVFHLYPLL